MNDLLLMLSAGLLFVITLLLGLLLKRMNRLLKNADDNNYAEFVRLLQNSEAVMSNGISAFRQESRDLSTVIRDDNQKSFANQQDVLLNRMAETSGLQNQHLNDFRTALSELTEKLITASNALEQSVSLSFQSSNAAINSKQDEFRDKTLERFGHFESTLKLDAKNNRDELSSSLKSFETQFSEKINAFNEQLRLQFSELNKQQADANQLAQKSIIDIRQTIENQLKAIRDDNAMQLGEMRRTVDEKLHDTLEKRLGESFKQVSDRLEQVHKGLGEMQTLAIGVGDLKKVLSNVKTRGILGEYQLGNILEQILSPDQYAINVATKNGSRDHVEFAVKLPGKSDKKTVWLPIDSKFPLESYQSLLAALEEGNPTTIDAAQKLLLKAVESFAKDISSKYIDPPHTTDFAILFLPIESLYAEVLRHPDLFERLQRTHRITITGPTTLSALLNSLNMGFRTLAVQKRSSEVWKVLAEVKTEFVKYSEQLATVHKHINSASNTLETLQTTRTNAMTRKLRGVESLEPTLTHDLPRALDLD